MDAVPEISQMNSLQNNQQPNEHEGTERQSGHAPVVPTQQARQGATGHNVRYVLGFGLAGIVLAFTIVYLVYFG
jgi:hypothetical protein